MTTAVQVKAWLDFALQQLAAESYLDGIDAKSRVLVIERLKYGFNNPSHRYIQEYVKKEGDQGADTPLLPGANRAPERLAERFFENYEVLEQFANNQFGFSATLLRHRSTGEYTLSFKSLEYPNQNRGGDWERDGLPGAAGEIGFLGFAVGQLASMEEYYRRLRAPDGRLAGVEQINVTGYSLGGHLATVFTLMHSEDVKQTVTFNAAGHGNVGGMAPTGTQVADMLATFTRILRDPRSVNIPSLAVEQEAATQLWRADPTWNPFRSENGNIENPKSLYYDPRYTFALAAIKSMFKPGSLVPSVSGYLNGATPLSGGGYDRITQLFGLATHDDNTLVANSQNHSANRIRILVEDQPDVSGMPVFFGQGTFGSTHNLALIVDTLSLVELLQTIDPNLTLEAAQGILAASSNLRGQGVLGVGQGRAEADSLENVLDALGKLLSVFQKTEFDDSARGFGNLKNRNEFHEHIQSVKDQLPGIGANVTLESLVKPLENQAQVGAVPGTEDVLSLAEKAETNKAYAYALKALNPFVLKGDKLYAAYEEGGASEYELDHFNPETGKGDLTEQWLEDRAEFLRRKLVLNLNNLNNDLAKRVNRDIDASVVEAHRSDFEDTIFEDRASDYRIDWRSDRSDLGNFTPRVIFGNNGTDRLEGANAGDRLYGDMGNDQLVGNGGGDHLEGGRGQDYLNGGAGEDELLGGKDADSLVGGAGFDQYYIRKGDGIDSIIDFSGDGFGGDGNGQIFLLENNLAGRKSFLDPSSGTKIWKDDNGNRYELVGLYGSARGLLRVSNSESTDGVLILGYQDGDLGITLERDAPPQKIIKSGTQLSDSLGDDAPLQKVEGLGGHDDIIVDTNLSEGWGGPGNDFVRDHYLVEDLYGGTVVPIVQPASLQALYGGEGRDILIASEGADELYGGDDADALQGGQDNDTLDGGDGDDLLDGGLGADVLFGGEGQDFLIGGGSVVPGFPWRSTEDLPAFGAYTVPGLPTGVQGMRGWACLEGDGTNVLDGGPGQDSAFGGDGTDFILGGAGNDLLVGGPGEDTLVGGDDADVLFGDGAKDEITFLGLPASPYFVPPAYQANDVLIGGAGADTLVGDGGSDELYGGEDNDELHGDSGFVPVEHHKADYLDGGGGDDKLWGDGGDDTLYGGEGDDILQGDSSDVPADKKGRDHLNGGAGKDRLTGDGGADILYGGTGDDFLFGDADNEAASADGNDHLDGEDGDDYLRGHGGDDVLFGGAGNDTLVGDGDGSREGETGADLLIGGSGNDLMDGGTGDDWYEVSTGDGIDKIFDQLGMNTIVFGEGITANSINVLQGGDGNGAYLVVGYGSGDQVAVKDGFTRGIDFYRFSDGTMLTRAELTRRLPLEAYLAIDGTNDDDILTSTDFVEKLAGGSGDDAYVFPGTNGHDVVTDTGGLDTLRFSAGVHQDDVTFRRESNGDLVVAVREGGEIRITGHYLDPASRIERVEFANTVIETRTLDDLPVAPIEGSAGDDRLRGSGFDDTLVGGAGRDELAGGAGSDTYVFRPGDGHDVVSDSDGNPGSFDRLALQGFRREDMVLERSASGTLTLRSLVSDDSVTLPDFYRFAANRIESIEFFADANGTSADLTLTAMQLDALPAVPLLGTSRDDELTGMEANDTLYGGEGDDRLSALAGEDLLDGGPGNDRLDGGAGDDTMNGGAGSDVYVFRRGSGQDVIHEADASLGSTDIDVIELGLDILPTDVTLTRNLDDAVVYVNGAMDSLRISGYFVDNSHKIEQIQFGNGVVWNDAIMQGKFSSATLLDDTLFGDASANAIDGLAGDDVIEGREGDDYLQGADGNDVLRGETGNDVMLGGAGNDTINGGADNDSVMGGSGDDALRGGSGNDSLSGGDGNDTYFYDLGDGDDTIYNGDGAAATTDVLVFGTGISAENVLLERANTNYQDLRL